MLEQGELSGSDFVARMSHEMRTPLSAILGFAQLMESATPAPTAAQKRSLELILQAGWYLDQLISATRDLALIESESLSVSLEHLSLASVMRDSELMIESQARARGVRVIFPVFEIPGSVLADGVRLQQVIGILLTAAIEGTAAGGTVAVECAAESSEWCRISISDGRIDDELVQAEVALEQGGIRVLLARRLVGLMGGAFAAETTVGAGRVFSFSLQRLDAPLTDRPTAAHSRIALPDSGRSALNANTGQMT